MRWMWFDEGNLAVCGCRAAFLLTAACLLRLCAYWFWSLLPMRRVHPCEELVFPEANQLSIVIRSTAVECAAFAWWLVCFRILCPSDDVTHKSQSKVISLGHGKRDCSPTPPMLRTPSLSLPGPCLSLRALCFVVSPPGPIPPELGRLRHLKHLALFGNSLTGA